MTDKETILSHLALAPFTFQFVFDPYTICNYVDTEDKPEVIDMHVTHPLAAFWLDTMEQVFVFPEAA